MKLGVRFHAKASKRWWPSEAIPRLGFDVDTKAMRVRLTTEKSEKGMLLCARRAPVPTEDLLSAKEILQYASYRNNLEWLVPGGL